MRRNFVKTRFVAMGLATAMVFSMVNVPAVANWQPPMANVLAAEAASIYTGTTTITTDELNLETEDWNNKTIVTYDNSISGVSVTENFTMTADVVLTKSGYESLADEGDYLKVQGVVKLGEKWTWTDSQDIPYLTRDSFEASEDGESYKASVTIKFTDITADELKEIDLIPIGQGFAGTVAFENVALTEVVKEGKQEEKLVYTGTTTEDTAIDFSALEKEDWDVIANITYATDIADVTLEKNAIVNAKLYIDKDTYASLAAEGSYIKPQSVVKIGEKWDWTQSSNTPELKQADFTEDGDGYSTTFQAKYSNIAGGDLHEIIYRFVGVGAKGSIQVSDVTVSNVVEASTELPEKEPTVIDDFENEELGKDAGWTKQDGWKYDGQLTGAVAEYADGNKGLKVSLDYSKNATESWSEAKIKKEFEAVDISAYNQISIDVIYPETLEDNSLKIKFFGENVTDDKAQTLIEKDVAISDAQAFGDGMKKATVTASIQPNALPLTALTLGIVGVSTDFAGDIYLDNLTVSQKTVEDYCVDSTKEAADLTGNIDIAKDEKDQTVLKTYTKDGKEEDTAITTNIKLVDKNADEQTKAVYSYLKAVGESDSVIFGHQNDTHHKAGASDLSDSDTVDVTGSYAGVMGIDSLSLTGDEYDVTKNEKKFGTQLDNTAANRVKAAAQLTNYNIEKGAIITLSAHMPNFSLVEEAKDYNEETDPTYAKYDFSGYTPNNTTGDVMNNILPGGKYNKQYTAFLDMIADYANQVDGTILFRPFHENTGSWFWWGAAHCAPSTYKNVWKYTVEYLRDTKGVHNLLYVYGPGSEAASVAEYGERYPGDNYVDMVGFDMYNSAPSEDNETTWFSSFKGELSIVEEFAKSHNKLVAVTETGVSNTTQEGENQTALLKKGNQHKDWYNAMLNAIADSDASYYLVWANFGTEDGYYTPFVTKKNENGTLHGHEMLDNFIDFFNDGRSVFASNQKDVLAGLAEKLKVTADATTESATGYITAPTERTRILTETNVCAKVSSLAENTEVHFVLNGAGDVQKDVKASLDGAYYTATITEELLAQLGEKFGTIDLYAGDELLDSVKVFFNIEEAEEDPVSVDNFENYYGDKSVLNQKWATNKDTGCTIDFSLNDDKSKVYEGDYSLKIQYTETSKGWAGATINKSADWSDYNALQFYTVPDGQNQKVVIQINAGGKTYETYLNDYDDYRDSTDPMLVTIPFSEFCARDDANHTKGGLVADSKSVSSIGLWVNAVKDTPAFEDSKTVSGVLYYDDVKAVNVEDSSITFKKLSAGEDTKKVEEVEASIKEIGEVSYTAESKAKIDAARKAYDALTDEQKKLVSEDTLKKLTDAEALYAKKKEEADSKKNPNTTEPKPGTTEKPATDQKQEAGQKKIETTKSTTGTVSVKWSAVKDASGYNVYVYNSSKKAYVKVASVTGTSTKISKINGKKLKAATVYKVKVVAYDKNQKELADSAMEYKTATSPKKVILKSAKKVTSSKVALKWKKVSGASGYEVYMKTGSGKYKLVKTIKKGKTVKYTKTKLKKGKKYTFKVRAYKSVDGKKVYGSYSKTKIVRLK